MARKPIPEAVQHSILAKSRRRCCLCFWLDGKDETTTGQIAHLDQDNANNAEDNLAFLCLNHHNDYDSTPRLTKGYSLTEVRRWRNMLYEELEYRFRSILKRGCELSFRHFVGTRINGVIGCALRIKNTGESAVKQPAVTLRLQEDMVASFKRPRNKILRGPYDTPMLENDFDMWEAKEERLDIFEPQGRVLIYHLPGIGRVLLAGHVHDFEALAFGMKEASEQETLDLEYSIDYAEGTPSRSVLSIPIPQSPREWMMTTDMGYGLPTEEQVAKMLKDLNIE